MNLTDSERSILDGREGEAKRFSLEILKKYGEAFDADRFVPVHSAHIVASSLQIARQAGIDLYRRLLADGARVSVTTTVDPGSIDFERWREHKVEEEWARDQTTVRDLLHQMGVVRLWTCTPYYLLNVPLFGQDVAWSESSAVVFVNSVIGARTNRMSAHIDLFAAITGLVPRFGLHVPENRRGEILIELDKSAAARFRAEHFPVLGYFIGQRAGDGIPVISGLATATFEELKSLGAAMAAAGAVAMYHIVGLTPEARTRSEAFGGKKPAETIRFGEKEMAETYDAMNTYDGGKIDVVALGCPNATIEELRQYAGLLEGRRVHPGIELWITTNRVVEEMGRKMGYVETIERAGGRMIVDTCLNNCPLHGWGFKNLVTNSGKYTYYNPSNLGTKVKITSLENCIETAVRGELVGGA